MNSPALFAVLFAVISALLAIGLVASHFWSASKLAKSESDRQGEAREFQSQLNSALSDSARFGAERDSALRELTQARAESQVHLEGKISAEKNLSAAREKISALSERIETRAKEEDDLRKKMASDFENLSNRLLEISRKKMSESNGEQLNAIIDPLKSNIKDFKQRIETLNLESEKSRAGLDAQIKGLVEMNSRLSKDAENLTLALRGNNKIAGNWGEAVLKRIFESCGFKEGIHFRAQESYADATGEQTRLVPDFIIDLPDSRSIVVDSKVSLLDYSEFFNAQEQSQKRVAIEKFKRSVRAHLKEFAQKYDNLPDAKAGFKMMFIPIEAAYDLVMSEDAKLPFDAYESNVLIVGPNSVMSVLKFAEIVIRNDALAKNTREIADLGALLYRRVNIFMDKFGKLGERVRLLGQDYETASKTLSESNVSVLSTAKRLAAKSSGNILESEIEISENE